MCRGASYVIALKYTSLHHTMVQTTLSSHHTPRGTILTDAASNLAEREIRWAKNIDRSSPHSHTRNTNTSAHTGLIPPASLTGMFAGLLPLDVLLPLWDHLLVMYLDETGQDDPTTACQGR